jgi:thiol:disulfide interchange protein
MTDEDSPETIELMNSFDLVGLPTILLIDETTGDRDPITALMTAPALAERMHRFAHVR